MKIAIMQPTYIPWAGYFALISYVDKFIFLDNVQFNERSWQQRNKIYSNGNIQWLTIPVNKKNYRNKKILDIEIDKKDNFYRKHLKTILQSYAKSKNLNIYKSLIERFYQKKFEKLSDMNIFIIKIVCENLGINTKFLNASEIIADGNKSDLLLKICKKLNCDEYVSPPGSRTYLDDDQGMFKKNKIEIKYFVYEAVEYNTFYKPFIPNLSVVDLILNCGKDSKKIILEGIRN